MVSSYSVQAKKCLVHTDFLVESQVIPHRRRLPISPSVRRMAHGVPQITSGAFPWTAANRHLWPTPAPQRMQSRPSVRMSRSLAYLDSPPLKASLSSVMQPDIGRARDFRARPSIADNHHKLTWQWYFKLVLVTWLVWVFFFFGRSAPVIPRVFS